MSEEEREIIRCQHCDLRQYATVSGNCRRCKQPPVPPPPAPPVPPGDSKPPQLDLKNRGHLPGVENHANLVAATALVLTSLRSEAGLSQSQMAARIGCARSYVSKVERSHAFPTIGSLDRFAQALGITLGGLVVQIDTLRAMIEAQKAAA